MAMPVAGTKLGPTLHLALHNIHYNVKAFGAVGDGVADDTAAINAAVNAIVTATVGGTIFFPPGAYKITSTINLTGKKHIHFQGASNPPPDSQFLYPPAVLITGAAMTTPLFYQDGSSPTNGELTFENLSIQAGRTGFAFSDVSEIRFRNVGVHCNLNDGHADNCAILMTNTFWGWYDNCALHAPSATTHAVILRGAVTGGSVDQSGLHRFRDTIFAGGAVAAQFNKQPSVGGQWHFENCLAEGCDTGMLKITQGSAWSAYDIQGVTFINSGVADATAGTDHPLVLMDAANGTVNSPVFINVTGGMTAANTFGCAMIVESGFVCGAVLLGSNRQSPYIVNGSDINVGSYIKDKQSGLEFIGDEVNNPTSLSYANTHGPTLRMGPGGTDTFAQVGISSTSARGITWGSGTAAGDTNLYRSAANRVKTDDNLHAVDGVTTKYKAGTPVDGDFATTPPDGTIVVDSSANKIWTRIGGTWKGVVVA